MRGVPQAGLTVPAVAGQLKGFDSLRAGWPLLLAEALENSIRGTN